MTPVSGSVMLKCKRRPCVFKASLYECIGRRCVHKTSFCVYTASLFCVYKAVLCFM